MSSSPQRVVFWVLAPFLVAFIAVMVFLGYDDWLNGGGLLRGLLIVAAVLLLFWFYDQTRFQWAGRTVAAMVFVSYAAYVAEALGRSHGRLRAWRGDPDPVSALLGLTFIGLPALFFAWTGLRDRE